MPAGVLFGSLAKFAQFPNTSHPIVTSYGYSCSGLMSTGIVLATIQREGWLTRLLSARWLTWIGTLSYGLYIFHGYLMGTMNHHLEFFVRHRITMLFPVTAFAITYGLASLSYRFLEQPFLRLKDRYAPSERKPRAALVF